nr:tautomerase family protein [Acetonema longum]
MRLVRYGCSCHQLDLMGYVASQTRYRGPVLFIMPAFPAGRAGNLAAKIYIGEGKNMPHISLMLYPGRTLATKEEFTKKLQALTVAELGCKMEQVSVSIEEVARENWQKDVVEQVKPGSMIIQPNF